MDETTLETLNLENILLKMKESTNDFYFKSKLQVIQVTKRHTSKGTPYLDLILRDKTDEIRCRKFIDTNRGEIFEEVAKMLEVGNIIEFNAQFQKNWNSIQIFNIKKLNHGNFDLTDFVQPSKINVSRLINTLDVTILKIKNEKLKQLLNDILSDEQIRIKFIEWPSSIKGHHSYKYGNLEHTISMIKIFETLEKFYDQNTLINTELIYTGIILHDIGKIFEYSLVNDVPRINSDTRLIGHLILGDQFVLKFINKIQDFPHELKNQIRHLILSHHGRKEWGSPIEPQIIEAEILHYLDMIDSRFNFI